MPTKEYVKVEPLRLKPLRPKNEYLLRESRKDIKDLKMASSASKQDEAIARYMAELKQAERDEANKVYKLKKAFLRGDSIEKVDADEALARRRAMAEALVRRKERALGYIEEKAAKDVAVRQAQLEEAKVLLEGEKQWAADSVKIAKDDLKKAKADAKRTKPSFIDRVRFSITGAKK